MFARESDMVTPVVGWMKSSGITDVRPEFVTPWGICDIAGATLNRAKSRDRLDLKQVRAVGSITAASLLLRIPDCDTGRPITRARLLEEFAPVIPAKVIHEQTERLIVGNFVESLSRGRLRRLNGWHPLQDRLVAVELKLSRVEEAMHQALNNLGFAEESYVALPAVVAGRVAADPVRWSRFLDAGVGLVSVSERTCRVLVPSHEARHLADEATRFYCVEKFWRGRVRGS